MNALINRWIEGGWKWMNGSVDVWTKKRKKGKDERMDGGMNG